MLRPAMVGSVIMVIILLLSGTSRGATGFDLLVDFACQICAGVAFPAALELGAPPVPEVPGSALSRS